MDATDEDGDGVRQDVDQPERVEGERPVVEHEVPATHGLALEYHRRSVGAAR